MERRNFNFLTANVSDSMFAGISNGKNCIIPDRTAVTLEDLKEINDLRSSINNDGLLGTLADMGIKSTPVSNTKFQIEPGDTIYVIVQQPGTNIFAYKNEERLPDDISINTIARYRCIPVPEMLTYIQVEKELK